MESNVPLPIWYHVHCRGVYSINTPPVFLYIPLMIPTVPYYELRCTLYWKGYFQYEAQLKCSCVFSAFQLSICQLGRLCCREMHLCFFKSGATLQCASSTSCSLCSFISALSVESRCIAIFLFQSF